MSTSWLQQFCPVKSGKNPQAKGICPIPKPIDGSNISCPVKIQCDSKGTKSFDGCPVNHSKSSVTSNVGDSAPATESATSGCPVKKSDQMNYNAPANDIEYNQRPSEGQKHPLRVDRQSSSIPKGSFSPAHQPTDASTWVYPSEQQYYNAMKRKGYDPKEDEIPTVLAIHNVVNEQGWSKIREWERMRGNLEPKLKSFCGRPKDKSPKAWFMTLFCGYEDPFDRHDWIIDRQGKEVRYVIDFYKGKTLRSGSPLAIFLDVRPALDSPAALIDRISYEFRVRFAPHSLPKRSLTNSDSEYSRLLPKVSDREGRPPSK